MRYPGGKGKCFQHIINLMPHHETYIETHLGGGAVFRNKKPAKTNIGIEIDMQVLKQWDDIELNQCKLINGDALDFLCSYPFVGNELVYSDPPYIPETRRRSKVYRHDYKTTDHEALLNTLIRLPAMTMVSGYESDLYNDLLKGWRKVRFHAKTHQDVREEVVWLNFPETHRLHDARFLGGNFRERQTIKRRQSRLIEKIHKLDSIERYELINLLTEKYGTQESI